MLDEDPVFVEQRDDVSDGSERDQVKSLAQIRILAAITIFASVLEESVADFEGHADACQLLDLLGGAWKLGVDDREGFQRFAAGCVVVGDDQVQLTVFRQLDGVVRGDSAVDCQEQVALVGLCLGDGFDGKPVAVVNPMGKIAFYYSAVFPEDPCDKRGRRNAVRVIVSVDEDSLSVVDGLPESSRGFLGSREEIGIPDVRQGRIQEVTYLLRTDPAHVQDKRNRPGHACFVNKCLYSIFVVFNFFPKIFFHFFLFLMFLDVVNTILHND